MSEPAVAGGCGGTEVAEQVQIGTQLRDRAEGQPSATSLAAPPQGRDGTLLAVIPIPGTRTSLAIVGYPVTAPGAAPGRRGRPARRKRGTSVPGCCSTMTSGGSGWTARRSR